MVRTSDFKKQHLGQDELLIHEIDIVHHETGETIKFLKSTTPLPIPRLGEELLISTQTITAEDGDTEWTEEDVLPEDQGLLYYVERIGHEYATIELDESARGDYRTGLAVRAHIRVTENKAE